ncbi:MAG: formylglycine-generating enzyme family protein [Planctomyces sp.]|nr:formylglycine-generating enzyme family protein [Planctomyces sp.]
MLLDAQQRNTFLYVACCLATCLSGCSSDSAVDPSQATTTEVTPTEPVSFESIPLSKDSSYESPPIPAGTEAGEVREFTALKIRFCWCPSGTFLMGSPPDALGSERNEQQFEVTLSKGFWIQQTELTQAQYQALMGVNPSHFRGDSNPVESLTHMDAREFCKRLSQLPPEQKSGNLYRLPTEAEWEYACRSGSTTSFCFGDDESLLAEYGWFNGNAARTTHPVGTRKPNAWNLYDMHGNVAEWCNDGYAEYPTTPQTDPIGADVSDQIVVRGGGWFFVPQNSRSAHRDAYPEGARYVGLGARLVAQPTMLSPETP